MADAIPIEQVVDQIKQDVDLVFKAAYARGYNTAKAEIALSGEYERAYQRGKSDAQQWIPCSERLPVEGESVLLCDRYGDMTLGRLVRTDEGYKWDIYAWWNDIDDWNAWMPLPEPYKEKDNERA